MQRLRRRQAMRLVFAGARGNARVVKLRASGLRVIPWVAASAWIVAPLEARAARLAEPPAEVVPVGEAPVEAPAGEVPVGEVPAGETPVSEAPMGEAASEAPVGEAPAAEGPAAEPAAEGPAAAPPVGPPEPRKGLVMTIAGAALFGAVGVPLSFVGIWSTTVARSYGLHGTTGPTLIVVGLLGLVGGATLLGLGLARHHRWRKWRAAQPEALSLDLGRTPHGAWVPGLSLRF